MTDNLVVRFAPDDFDLEALEDFYDYVGVTLDKALKPVKQYDDDDNLITDDKGRPKLAPDISPKAQTALVWLSRRLDDPSFTIAQAKKIKPKVLEIVVPEVDDAGEEESGDA